MSNVNPQLYGHGQSVIKINLSYLPDMLALIPSPT